MKNSAGVWVDHKNAKVAYLDDAKKTVSKYSIEADEAGKTVAAKRAKAAYTPNDFVAEDRLERKQAALRKKLYDQVIADLQNIESVLIVGPGDAKLEFQKRLRSKKLRTIVVKTEATDKMTDRQLIAYVRTFFKAAPPRKTARRA
jgi:hypothetical protein